MLLDDASHFDSVDASSQFCGGGLDSGFLMISSAKNYVTIFTSLLIH
jgi:hypothetical protein